VRGPSRQKSQAVSPKVNPPQSLNIMEGHLTSRETGSFIRPAEEIHHQSAILRSKKRMTDEINSKSIAIRLVSHGV
jgi:hypothetical protein